MRKFFFLIGFFLASLIHAQDSDTADVGHIINDLNSYWKKYSYKNPIQNDSNGIKEVRTYLATPLNLINSTSNNKTHQVNENNLRAAILRKDWGLKFTTGYLENFNPSFNDDDNLLYNRRIQAGVNWDILNSGLLENRTLAKVQEMENLILQSAVLPTNRSQELTIKWNEIIYRFNIEKLKILDERKKLIEKQNQAAQQLFLLKYLTKENYLENEKRLAEIKSMYAIYKDFNEQLKSIGLIVEGELDFPLVDIQYDKIFRTSEDPSIMRNDSLYSLILAKNQLQYKYWNNVNLGTFVRYNYYDLVIADPATRAFMSAGVNVSLPITFNSKENKKLIEARSLNEYDKLMQVDQTQTANRLDDGYEFRYKLKQYLVFYQKKILFQEILRKENARSKIDPVTFNPYKILAMQDDVLAIDLELIELKQNMYLKLLKIVSDKPSSQIPLLCKPYLIPEKVEYEHPLSKTIYAWSKALELDSSFIAEYLRFHDFKSISLSSGKSKEEKLQFAKLCRYLTKEGFNVELMIGDNSLTFEKVTEILKSIPVHDETIKGLHIDYEPHTLADWDQNKGTYLARFTEMLMKLQSFCKERNWTLTIDIPLHYPKEDVNQFLQICDNVCFMAYENVKTNYITEKVNAYNNYKSKIAIALRTNDFKSRVEMEQKLNELSTTTGIDHFYYHDLNRCMEMDEKLLEKKEK